MTEAATQPKRRGAPPKPAEAKRRPRNISLTDAAWAAIQARAGAMSASAWIEHVALHGKLPKSS